MGVQERRRGKRREVTDGERERERMSYCRRDRLSYVPFSRVPPSISILGFELRILCQHSVGHSCTDQDN